MKAAADRLHVTKKENEPQIPHECNDFNDFF